MGLGGRLGGREEVCRECLVCGLELLVSYLCFLACGVLRSILQDRTRGLRREESTHLFHLP